MRPCATTWIPFAADSTSQYKYYETILMGLLRFVGGKNAAWDNAAGSGLGGNMQLNCNGLLKDQN